MQNTHDKREMIMKTSHKKSNRMLMGAALFLVVYLLVSVIFGTSLLSRFATNFPVDRSVTQVTVWRNW